jgi:hypothetical protein
MYMRVYAHPIFHRYTYKSLTLQPLIRISTKPEIGKTRLRVYTFIHSLLFMPRRSLLIDIIRLFYFLSV